MERFEKVIAIEYDRHFVSEKEIKQVAQILNFSGLTNKELSEERNNFVRFVYEKEKASGDEYDEKLGTALSAVTAVIDNEKFKRGMVI
jgi:hypothetical protein